MYYLSSKSHLGSLAVQGKEKKLQKYPRILLETILTAAGKLGHALKLLPSQKLPRKLLAGVLSLSMLFSLLPLTTFAAEQQPTLPADSMLEEQQGDALPEVLAADNGPWDISMDKDGTVTATLSGGTLTIQGTGMMMSWGPNMSTFWGTGITAVTIDGGVTSIGHRAFKGCTDLASVTIPTTVTDIGSNAFYGCTSLNQVIIPTGVSSIGDSAFSGCAGLNLVSMNFQTDKKGKTIGSNTFADLANGAAIQLIAVETNPSTFTQWSSTAKSGGTAATFDQGANPTTNLTNVPSNCTITANYGSEAEWTPTGGTKTSGTFADALTAMGASGGSIKLLSEVSTDTVVTLPAKAITLDLDGKTWTSKGIIVPSAGTLTVTDTSGGKITRSVGGAAITVQWGGQLDLQSGEIASEADGYYGISNEGTTKLSGTAKVSGDAYAVANDESGVLYLSGSPVLSVYDENDPTIWCNGSSLVIANNGKVGEELVYCAKPISIQVYNHWVGPVIVSGLEDASHAATFTCNFSKSPEGAALVYDDTDKTLKLVKSYGIYVGNTPIDENNKDNVFGDGKVQYDDKTSTLTLKDVTIKDDCMQGNSNDFYGIFSDSEEPLTLVLNGNNKIDIEGGKYGYGVRTGGSLTISGNGSLKITANGTQEAYGILSRGDFTLDSGSIDITAGDAASETNGIFGFNVLVNAGTLKIVTGEAQSSYGVYAEESILVTNGVVDITAGPVSATVWYGESMGMYCDAEESTPIQITGGTVTTATKGDTSEDEILVQAILPAPDFSEYNRGVAVGSVNGDGSSTVTYSAADNDTYKYVKIYKKPNRPVVTPTPAPTATPTPTVTPTPGPTEAPSKGETTVTTPVDQDGNASVLVSDENVNDAIAQAKENATPGQPIAVSIVVETDQVASKITATLPKTVQETLIGNKVNSITIVSDTVTMGFTQEAIQLMNNQAKADIDIIATKASTQDLTGEAAELIGDRPLYDFTAIYNRIYKITDFGGNTVSLSIPYVLREGENPEDVEAVYVDEAGEATSVEDSVYNQEKQSVDFTVSHFSGYGVGYRQSVPLFKDIENHWAKADIEFVAEKGLLLGMGDQMFSPNTPMTRGMFVTALGRLAGIDPAEYKSGKFTDVKEGAYYAPYVHWAAEKGIVNGTGEFTFSPNQGITRQEMAVIMINYATAFDYTIPETLDPVTFADQDDIGTWAAEAVRQMQMAGVMNGRNDTTFDPTGTATRAEVAAVLHRYIERVIHPVTA